MGVMLSVKLKKKRPRMFRIWLLFHIRHTRFYQEHPLFSSSWCFFHHLEENYMVSYHVFPVQSRTIAKILMWDKRRHLYTESYSVPRTVKGFPSVKNLHSLEALKMSFPSNKNKFWEGEPFWKSHF